MNTVDAHVHFWQLARGDYGWLTPASIGLYRDFLPEDLTGESGGSGPGSLVVVQAAATEAETHFLLSLARSHSQIGGVVGWVDFEAANAAARITALVKAGDGYLKGLRPMVQDIADPAWLLRPALDDAFNALVQHDLAFDALVKPGHLKVLHERLSRHPGMRAMLDHAGKPDIAGGGFDAWAADIARLAADTQALCKLSGLLGEAGNDASIHAIAPYVAHVFDCFGPQRVAWGSDWPLVRQQVGYAAWRNMAEELVQRFAPGHEAAIFADNARRFYQLPLSTSTAKEHAGMSNARTWKQRDVSGMTK